MNERDGVEVAEQFEVADAELFVRDDRDALMVDDAWATQEEAAALATLDDDFHF